MKHLKNQNEQALEIGRYNAMVIGVHGYYQIATKISQDCRSIAWEVNRRLYNKFKYEITKKGQIGNKARDCKRYGKSKQLRFIGKQWILPIGYCQNKHPKSKNKVANLYTVEGRAKVHDVLAVRNKWIIAYMAENPVTDRSVEYNDNRISLFAAQWGKCAITGQEFLTPEEVHCHHKKTRKLGGTDKYANLVLVTKEVHILIHASKPETVNKYLVMLNLNSEQKTKLNNLRIMAGCEPV